MGASSASTAETTINTSTESASTLATNVTGTDTSETCDSLDLGKKNLFFPGDSTIAHRNAERKNRKKKNGNRCDDGHGWTDAFE